VAGRGVVVLAVDNLPCELPIDASEFFGDSLVRYVGPLARCDWNLPFERLNLPDHLRRAVIVHRGALTPAYEYLAGPAAAHGKGE
jgi:alpha-aminoadipic semialdehyde synthase